MTISNIRNYTTTAQIERVLNLSSRINQGHLSVVSDQERREGMTVYIYKVIRERLDGTQGKRSKEYWCYAPELTIGGLYAHLGVGFPGLQRVLSMTTKEIPD